MRFSVIVPTFNRPIRLDQLLAAWSRVDYPPGNFEILIADDGGSADLGPMVATHAAAGLPVRLLSLPHVSASAARASGLAQARGELILCTDDDCRPDPGILQAYERAAKRHPGAALGGTVFNLLVDDLLAEATQEIITFVGEYWNRDPLDAVFFTVSNLVFPAEALRQVGGFDPGWLWRTGEDRDLCRRWCERGGRMISVPDAIMGHAHPLTLTQFWRQHFHYGQGNFAARSNRRIRGAGAPDHSGPSFYLGLFAFPFRRLGPGRAPAVGAAILFAQIANLCGVMSAWRTRRRDETATAHPLTSTAPTN